MTTNPPPEDPKRRQAFGALCELFATKVIPRLGEELKEIDPAGDYAAAAAQSISGSQLAAAA